MVEELIIPRLQGVIKGNDQTGVSKEVNWQGGGGFKYYKLGESVIHEQDMNWALKAEEMAEGIQQMRIIDKENDRYQKKIINEATGEVVVDKDIKLSEKNNL